MARLKHDQSDPLPLKPLLPERADYMWEQLQASPGAYDDYTVPRGEFDQLLFANTNATYEIGDGVGLLTLVNVNGMAGIQFALFDWDYGNRFKWFRGVADDLFHWHPEMHKMLAAVTTDRSVARDMVKYLGFSQEATMRKAHLRLGEYHDVELWGLLREDFFDGMYGPREVYT